MYEESSGYDMEAFLPWLTRKPYLQGGQPWHSLPTQTLWKVYVQNASLEIAWTRVLQEHGNISGNRIMPFFTEGYEGFDFNTEDDWILAEALLERGLVTLPKL